jgi:hypothetical protein
MRLAVATLALAACGSAPAKLFPAGTDKDEGHGELAKASSKFMTTEEREDDLFNASARKPRVQNSEFGGSPYGGDPYGGGNYASFVVPSWSYPSVNRTPHYNQTTGLSGAIEGVVSWRGAIPAKRESACGPLDVIRVGPDRGLADVLVYIEHIQIGRTLPNDGRPSSVGGVVVKRGCALVPTLQIVTPLPASLAIHGDAKRTQIRVTNAPAPAKLFDVQEGGRVAMQVAQGVTRIDAEDGSLAPAWVVALDTPSYAITDDLGHFRIDELAPGTYEVTIWQAPVFGDGKYGAPLIVHRSIKVEAAKSQRLDVSLAR